MRLTTFDKEKLMCAMSSCQMVRIQFEMPHGSDLISCWLERPISVSRMTQVAKSDCSPSSLTSNVRLTPTWSSCSQHESISVAHHEFAIADRRTSKTYFHGVAKERWTFMSSSTNFHFLPLSSLKTKGRSQGTMDFHVVFHELPCRPASRLHTPTNERAPCRWLRRARQ